MAELNLSGIDQAPRAIPVWDAILADLGRPAPARVARVLGVGRSTVYNWTANNNAPRVACLALFWLTRWGRSAVHTQATNDAMVAVQLARSLTTERNALQRQVEELDREARELAWQVATTRRADPFHGNAAIGAVTRRDTAPEGSSEASAASQQQLASAALGWPTLDSVASWPQLQPPQPEAPEATHRGAGHQGSPAARPPAAHSGKSPGPARSPLPGPSVQPEASLSSPLVPDRCQNGAIMTPPDLSALTCFIWDKPAAAAGRRCAPPAAVGRLDPSALRLHSPHGGAAGEDQEYRSHGAQQAPADLGAPEPATVPQGAHASLPLASQLDARSGTPPSAARPERPVSMGQAPYPPPRADHDATACAVFAALVRATTNPREVRA